MWRISGGITVIIMARESGGCYDTTPFESRPYLPTSRLLISGGPKTSNDLESIFLNLKVLWESSSTSPDLTIALFWTKHNLDN
jgi:hypothetical protein